MSTWLWVFFPFSATLTELWAKALQLEPLDIPKKPQEALMVLKGVVCQSSRMILDVVFLVASLEPQGTNLGWPMTFFLGGGKIVTSCLIWFECFPYYFPWFLAWFMKYSEGSWFGKKHVTNITFNKTTVDLVGLLEHPKNSTRIPPRQVAKPRGLYIFDQRIWHSAGYLFQNRFVRKNPKSGRKGVLAPIFLVLFQKSNNALLIFKKLVETKQKPAGSDWPVNFCVWGKAAEIKFLGWTTHDGCG